MIISDALANEIYTIIFFHALAVALVFSFSLYLFFRAKKTPLLYSYLSVVATILIWMISKILKTAAPTEELRWIFIVTQYLGAEFLGFCLVLFAYIYSNDRVPKLKMAALAALLPVVSFLIVLTNPLHHGFYSYYDFYRDRFGFLFYIIQGIQYCYWLAGIWLLSRGFMSQRGFHGKRLLAALFGAATLVPVIANFYYVLFKLGVVPWILPFETFDFTPIAASVSLMIFSVPAMRFRFFDISPISYHKLYESMPRGLIFMDSAGAFYGGNRAFYSMFSEGKPHDGGMLFSESAAENALLSFAQSADGCGERELGFQNGKTYRITKNALENGHMLFCIADITELTADREELEKHNVELLKKKQRLDELAENTRALSIARTKAQAAQNMHDILGHSLTVVIGTAEVAAVEEDEERARRRLLQVAELLTNSLGDLRNTLSGAPADWSRTSLIKAVGHLENESLAVDILAQGNPYEISSAKTEAVFRLCQEAVTNAIKHGRAKTIHLVLRYKPEELEVFAIDDGIGCCEIEKSYGLSGIESRITSLSGAVEFGSNGEKGFTIHATLPRFR